MEIQILNLSIGLMGLMIINIVLGSVDAIFKKSFDKQRFIQGIIKGVIVTFCFMGTYYIGKLNPDVIVIDVNGQEVNVLTSIYLTILAGFITYAKQVIDKLRMFINGNFEVENNNKSEV